MVWIRIPCFNVDYYLNVTGLPVEELITSQKVRTGCSFGGIATLAAQYMLTQSISEYYKQILHYSVDLSSWSQAEFPSNGWQLLERIWKRGIFYDASPICNSCGDLNEECPMHGISELCLQLEQKESPYGSGSGKYSLQMLKRWRLSFNYQALLSSDSIMARISKIIMPMLTIILQCNVLELHFTVSLSYLLNRQAHFYIYLQNMIDMQQSCISNLEEVSQESFNLLITLSNVSCLLQLSLLTRLLWMAM